MILDNQDRHVLNNQSITSPHNEPQRSPGFAQKQPSEVFCKKRCSQNFCKFHRKATVLGCLFPNVAGLQVLHTPTLMFYYKICKIFKNTYFEEHLRKTPSIYFTSKYCNNWWWGVWTRWDLDRMQSKYFF